MNEKARHYTVSYFYDDGTVQVKGQIHCETYRDAIRIEEIIGRDAGVRSTIVGPYEGEKLWTYEEFHRGRNPTAGT